MASSIRILSSKDVDRILADLDIDQLIDVHTARLFRTLANPGAFVDSPHRLTVQAGNSTDRSTDGSTDPPTGRPPGPGGPGGPGGGGLYTTLVMPSSVENYGTTVKLVSVPNPAPASNPTDTRPPRAPRAPTRGLPATTAVVDERTGAVKAVVNARALNIRTALGECVCCVVWSRSSGAAFCLFWDWVGACSSLVPRFVVPCSAGRCEHIRVF
jgi:hypothetical protein